MPAIMKSEREREIWKVGSSGTGRPLDGRKEETEGRRNTVAKSLGHRRKGEEGPM